MAPVYSPQSAQRTLRGRGEKRFCSFEKLLSPHPLCVLCELCGEYTPVTTQPELVTPCVRAEVVFRDDTTDVHSSLDGDRLLAGVNLPPATRTQMTTRIVHPSGSRVLCSVAAYKCRRRNAGVSPAGPEASRLRRVSVEREIPNQHLAVATEWRRGTPPLQPARTPAFRFAHAFEHRQWHTNAAAAAAALHNVAVFADPRKSASRKESAG